MDLRKLARNAYVKANNRDQLAHEEEFELKEEIILQGQEIEGLNAEIVDLSRQNELLRHENFGLRNEIGELKAVLEFMEMTHDKR